MYVDNAFAMHLNNAFAMHLKCVLQCIQNTLSKYVCNALPIRFFSQALGEQYEMPWLACVKAGASVVMKSELKGSEVRKYQDLVSHFVFVLSLSKFPVVLTVLFFSAGRE